MRQNTYRRDLESVYRTSAIRVIFTYLMVFTDAASVIAGTIPVHITVEEDRRNHLVRRQTELDQLEDHVMNSWQHDWLTTTKGGWT